VIIVVVVVVPVLLGLPAMFVAIPPLMVQFPATLPLGIQVAPAFVGCTAVLAMVCDRAVESGLGPFDGVATVRMIVVGVDHGYRSEP